MRKKVLYVINPISGAGRQKGVEKLVIQHSDDRRIDYNIECTKSAGQATEISKIRGKDYDAIIAAGGDGSINEIVQGLINTDTALGIIPTGSGNGFARHLKIPLKIEKAIGVINDFNVTRIDSAKINEHYFVNVAGIGFDALIAHKFAIFGKRGFASYVKVTAKELIRFKPLPVNLTTDGVRHKVNAFLLSIANGSQFGNNACIAPGASMKDGILNITVLNKFPLVSAPSLVYRLFTKTLERSKYTQNYTAQSIALEKEGEIIAHMDGDPYKFKDQIKIDALPESLNVIVPKNDMHTKHKSRI